MRSRYRCWQPPRQPLDRQTLEESFQRFFSSTSRGSDWSIVQRWLSFEQDDKSVWFGARYVSAVANLASGIWCRSQPASRFTLAHAISRGMCSFVLRGSYPARSRPGQICEHAPLSTREPYAWESCSDPVCGIAAYNWTVCGKKSFDVRVCMCRSLSLDEAAESEP